MERSTPSLLVAAATALFFVTAGSAGAAIDEYTDPDVGGFVADSATPAFQAAIGAPTSHTGFEVDRNGSPLPGDGAVPGGLLSAFAVLASPDAASPGLVVVNGADVAAGRVGASPGFTGVLEIRFANAGFAATAVGFGAVDLGTSASVRLLDLEGAELYTTSAPSDERFTFLGMVATEGEQIGTVVIESDSPWALQDLQMVVPEPGATAQLAAAFLSLAALATRRGARAASA